MKKTTYIIIGLLILVLVLQIIFFCLLKVSAEPWEDYMKRIGYDANRDVEVEIVSEDKDSVAVEEINDYYITSLSVPDSDDIEVVIRVKQSSKLKKDPQWSSILGQDTINANTLMINVDGKSTMKVEISQAD